MHIQSDIRQQLPAILLLRFTTAGLMLFHGVAKAVNGIGKIEDLVAAHGLPAWTAVGVLIGELVAPLLVLLGLWVRPAALVMAFNMIAAIGLAHSGDLLKIGPSGGYRLELQVFFLVCSLVIAWMAGGRSSSGRG
jgi:putative oxidoreductase